MLENICRRNKKVSSETTQPEVLVVVGVGDHLRRHLAPADRHLHDATMQPFHAAFPFRHALIGLHFCELDLHLPAVLLAR